MTLLNPLLLERTIIDFKIMTTMAIKQLDILFRLYKEGKSSPFCDGLPLLDTILRPPVSVNLARAKAVGTPVE